MATFNSVNIFGPSPTMVVQNRPRSSQTNAYAGQNGVEALDMGERVSTISVTGQLVGASLSALRTAEQTFRSYKNGHTYLFVDTDGAIWSEVELLDFSHASRLIRDASGSRVRRYTATFLIIYP